jgi:outer membrane protein OmpA-like peptidoglycan-associated protein
MNPKVLGLLVACLALPPGLVVSWIGDAEAELARIEAEKEANAETAPQVAVAAAADVEYCTPELKKILRRVLQSCGLASGGAGRGCQPTQAKDVAALGGNDFNALFLPLADRAGIIQFDKESSELDPNDQLLVEKMFADQRGASWFFVVARSSPEGSETFNRDLSEQRGNAVLAHLKSKFQDPDLDKEVGLLWLGEEFAQLESDFCHWTRSGPADACTPEELNRSAFVAWIDCRL